MKSLSYVFPLISLLLILNGCDTLQPNEPPVARIGIQTTQESAPLRVTFTDQSTGEIDSRLWTFPNGETSTERVVSYVYGNRNPGVVTLTVTGPGGSDSASEIIQSTGSSATFTDLEYTVNTEDRTITLTAELNMVGYRDDTRVFGIYWVQRSGSNYRFVNSSCNRNAPNNALGSLGEITPTYDNNLGKRSATFAYSCFPDRTNATYYAYAILYDRDRIEDVLTTNDPNLAIIGPPSTEVTLRWP